MNPPSRAAAAASLVVLGALGALWRYDAHLRDAAYRRLHRATVDLLLNTLTAGDAKTARHSRRVADLADALAGAYGLGRDERATLRVAALLHDLGKMDDRFFDIVHSCAPLTEEQRHEIRLHPRESAHILEPLEDVHPGIMAVVASHHERWDGGGYPRGLRGREIPLGARIVSVADVFDAMTQQRRYRDALPVSGALAEIRGSAGHRFDPEVVRRVERPAVLARWREIVREGRAAERAGPGGGDEARAARE